MSNDHKAEGAANGGAEQKTASNGQPRPAEPVRRPAEAPPAEAEQPGAAEIAGDEPASGSSNVDALLIEIETLKAQVADLTGRMLRAHADMDNLRKRAEREKQETARYAISKFARDTVEVADNFARAINAVPAEAVAQNEQLKALLEGVSMTERAFLGVLERHGVKQVAPVRESFNPHLHQAVMERHDTSVPAGTVLECFQPGYIIEDRCLRPAIVVVSTGGPKAARSQQSEKPAGEPDAKPEAAGGGTSAGNGGNGGGSSEGGSFDARTGDAPGERTGDAPEGST